MNKEDLKNKVESIQQQLNKLLGGQVKDPSDFDTDYKQLSDLSFEFMNTISESYGFEQDIGFVSQIIQTFIEEFEKYISSTSENLVKCINFILEILFECSVLLIEDLSSLQVEKIIKTMASYYQKFSDPVETGLDLLSEVAINQQDKIVPYADLLWTLVVQGWNCNSTILKISSLKLIQDLATALKDNFNPKKEIIEEIIDQYEKQETELQIKSQIIIVLGDLFLNQQDFANPYLDRTLKALEDGLKLATELAQSPQNTSELQEDIIVQFNQNLIESFQCIILAMEKNIKILSITQALNNFLKVVCREEMEPSQDFLINSIGLLADLVRFFQQDVKFMVNEDYIKFAVKRIKEEDSSNQILNYYLLNVKQLK